MEGWAEQENPVIAAAVDRHAAGKPDLGNPMARVGEKVAMAIGACRAHSLVPVAPAVPTPAKYSAMLIGAMAAHRNGGNFLFLVQSRCG